MAADTLVPRRYRGEVTHRPSAVGIQFQSRGKITIRAHADLLNRAFEKLVLVQPMDRPSKHRTNQA